MQLSRDEFLRVSQLELTRSPVAGIAIGNVATAPSRRSEDYAIPDFSLMNEAKQIAEQVETQEDNRDEIVASLRNRIEAGTYIISGDQIADMLVRRLLADRVR